MDKKNLHNRNKNLFSPTFHCVQINLGHGRNALQELIYHTYSNNSDIIFINEPYTGNSTNMKNIPGYTIHEFPSQRPAKALLAFRNGSISTLGITEFSDSNLCIMQINSKNFRKTYLISIYIEPRTDKNGTLKKLENFLHRTAGSNHIICGDFNGWHSLWGSSSNNKRGNSTLNLISNNNLVICNTGNTPTFETVTHGIHRESIIDLTLISNTGAYEVYNWSVDLNICPSSDHNAITFDLHFGPVNFSKNCKLSTFRYNTLAVKWDHISDNLYAEIASRLPNRDIEGLDKNGLDKYISELISAIQKSCDKLLPLAAGPPQRAPWWNEHLEQLKQKVIANHHKLIKLKRRKVPLDETIAERDNLKTQYSNAVSTASLENFKEFCNRQKKEDVWSVTNRIIKTKPLTQPPATLKRADGSYTADSMETAKVLIDRFYPDDTPDCTSTQQKLRSLVDEPVDGSLEQPFTTDEIIECLKSMNHKKAPGPDHLTADICFQFAKGFPKIITDVMNRCLSLAYFPDCWKVAYTKIIPKPNKTDYSDPASFRPIGLIDVFGKLLEKLIINRLTHHMYVTNTFCKNQFGFKQQTSTGAAIHNALDIIKQAKSEKQHVIAVSLDIKSAFDSAWWPAMFQRLRQIKCPRNIYKILCSYVQNRQVNMKFANCSVSKQMSRGCIQGSVCGPTLWNLILDELLAMPLPPGCHLQAYADDVLLISHSKDIKLLQHNINTTLQSILLWGKEIKLEFGPDKTQVIGFTNKSLKCKIFIHGQTVNFVNHIKYLGIIIDRKMTFIKHCEFIIDKAKALFYKLNMFIRPTWGVHPGNVKTIYLQVIEPIICYAASVWSEALKYKYVNKRLLSLQRLFSIKMIQGFRTVSTAAAISLAQLTPLPAKIMEVSDNLTSKLRGNTRFLPTDLSIDLPISPSELLHPSLRKCITYDTATTLSELNDLGFTDWIQIYTDGSRNNDKVGSAFVILHPNNTQLTKKFKLHECCSVFQAELLAIKKACEYIISKKFTNTIILSDSKSGLQEITNPNSRYYLTVKIQHLLLQAQQLDLTIKFVWVKAHAGIPGNETADIAAKSASTLHKQACYNRIPISYIKFKNKEISAQSAQLLYENNNSCTYTKTWLPSYEELTNYVTIVKPNFAITQLLTNHGYHKEYLNRFKITTDNVCPCDGTSVQSLEHLIKHCPRFASTRLTHTIASNILNINPYCLNEICKKDTTIDTFHSHIHYIVKKLKSFNS